MPAPLRLDNLRIGARLSAVFALCGLLIAAAFIYDLVSEDRLEQQRDQVSAVLEAQQIGDDLLVAINDLTGWQGLYVADAAAYGVEKGLAEDAYNVQGFDTAWEGVQQLFSEADTSALTEEEAAIVQDVEAYFTTFHAEDAALREMLRSEGLEALPDVMASINDGPAGAAWTDTYEANAEFQELIDARVEKLEAKVDDTSAGQRVRVAGGLALAALVTVLLLVHVTRSITAPLRQIADQLRQVAAGRLDVRSGLERTDEVGEMSRALDEALESLSTSMRGMDDNAQSLAAASEELLAVSAQLSGSAAESTREAKQLAGTADSVSGNVSTLAAGTEQMSASIREIARSAAAAADVAGGAVLTAESTSTTVAKLGDSSSEIGNVVKVISSIAEQTNLLALNATIEAARAGEAGKGFAVVAGEVKELAQETSRATGEISSRIAAIQADTSAAVQAIAEISAVIAQISDSQTTIAAAVEEQTATTNEMSRHVTQAASGSLEIAGSTSGLARLVADGDGAASSTSAAAEELARMAAQMREQVGRFTY